MTHTVEEKSQQPEEFCCVCEREAVVAAIQRHFSLLEIWNIQNALLIDWERAEAAENDSAGDEEQFVHHYRCIWRHTFGSTKKPTDE